MHVFKDAHPPVAAGITRYMGDLAAASAARGHDVQLLVAGVRSPRTDQRSDGVTVRRVREWGRALSMPLSPRVVTETARLDADIVHLHLPFPLGELGVLRNTSAGAVVASFHAQLGKQRLLAPIFGPAQRAALQRCGRVFASSRILADSPELSGVSERVVLAPYGVSPQMVAPARPTPRPNDGPLRLLFVGRLVYYKGVEVLFDALRSRLDVELTVVGDGALRGDLERLLAESPELTARVRMVHDASDDDVIEMHGQHDVVVLPSVSRAEAFGLSMAEAMANGLPAISTQLGTGTDWVNIHDETGLTVPAGDSQALGVAIDQMRDADLRCRLAEGAITRARSVFAFDRHADLVHDNYERALGARPSNVDRLSRPSTTRFPRTVEAS